MVNKNMLMIENSYEEGSGGADLREGPRGVNDIGLNPFLIQSREN